MIGCSEVWGRNDVTTEDIPNYLVKLYCGIIRNIQALWDALSELDLEDELEDSESNHLSDLIADLEKQLAKSAGIPDSTQIKEVSSGEWIICQAEVNTKKYFDLGQEEAKQVAAAEQKANRKLEKIIENEQTSNSLMLPNITGATSQSTTPRRYDAEHQMQNGEMKDKDKSPYASLPSLKSSSNSLVSTPNPLCPSPPPTDGERPLMAKISHSFNPPNMDIASVSSVHESDYAYGEQQHKPKIAALASPSKTRLTPKWRSNVGYPFGSSFPQLPPISKKRRLTGAKQDSAT